MIINFTFNTYRERNIFIKFLNSISKDIDININKAQINVDFKDNNTLLELAQKYYLALR